MTTEDATWRDLLLGGADMTDAECEALDRLVATVDGARLFSAMEAAR